MSDNTKILAERVAFEQGVTEGKAEALGKIGEDVVKYAHQRGVAAGKSAVSKMFRERIGFGKARVKALNEEVAAIFDSRVKAAAEAIASGETQTDA